MVLVVLTDTKDSTNAVSHIRPGVLWCWWFSLIPKIALAVCSIGVWADHTWVLCVVNGGFMLVGGHLIDLGSWGQCDLTHLSSTVESGNLHQVPMTKVQDSVNIKYFL
jgi:hypothetical protein